MIITEKTEWFTIESDPRTRQSRIALMGLWNDAAFARFELALVDVIGKLVAAGAPYGTYRTLIDLRDQGILTQRVAELAKGLAAGPGEASERIAVVVSNTLHKMQQTRINQLDHLKVFQDFAEAEAWIFSDG